MSSTSSVSKGCFVFKSKTKGKKRDRNEEYEFCGERWYSSYKQTWKWIEEKMQALHERSFSSVINDLVSFIAPSVEDSAPNQLSTLPTAVLLTGINMPDHSSLFSMVCEALKKKATPHIAVLYAHKCNTLNATMQQMIYQFMSGASGDCKNCDSEDEEEEEEEEQEQEEVKKTARVLNMNSLRLWFKKQMQRDRLSPKKQSGVQQSLVVIVPDFEKFCAPVLHDLILILSAVHDLPFVLVLGVATSISAVHKNLPHRVTARLCLKVLHAPPSLDLLNLFLEEVLFSPNCPFRLGSRIFNFLIDVFLCCDLSVRGFVQAVKFCLAEHMSGQPWKVLCCTPRQLKACAQMLTKDDVNVIRKLPSFHRFLSGVDAAEQKRLLTDDLYMKTMSVHLLREMHTYLSVFHCALQCLCVLTSDLPQHPLGTRVRELYGQAVGCSLWQTAAYKACFRYLGFLSRQELVDKVEAVLALLHEGSKSSPSLTALAAKLSECLDNLEKAGTNPVQHTTASASPEKQLSIGKLSRLTLREDLLSGPSRTVHPTSPWEEARKHLLDFLAGEALPQMLSPPTERPLAELIFFERVEGSARAHIAAAPRASLHTALRRPQSYLKCSCCSGESSSTAPDIVVAYRLYEECGRFINLFDWLQAFATIVNPCNNDQAQIDDCIQARFTRVLADLQYMGFLKTSSRKVDHVVKLSFGGQL